MPITDELYKKVKKLAGGAEFKDEVDRLSVQQLESRITNYQKQLDESREHKNNNEVLNNIKAEKATIEAPYRDVENAIKIKTKYLIELIKEKGGT